MVNYNLIYHNRPSFSPTRYLLHTWFLAYKGWYRFVSSLLRNLVRVQCTKPVKITVFSQ